ncbi:MAG: hypothetical protein WC707_06045 [Candidatus Babeliaceae bacterium]|jgi:hypothetical protein
MKKLFLLLPLFLHTIAHAGSEETGGSLTGMRAALAADKMIMFNDKKLVNKVFNISKFPKQIAERITAGTLQTTPEILRIYQQARFKSAMLNALKTYFDNNTANWTKNYTFDQKPVVVTVTEDDKKVLGDKAADTLIKEINTTITSIAEYLTSAKFGELGQKNIIGFTVNDLINDYFNYLAAFLTIQSPYFYDAATKKEGYAQLEKMKLASAPRTQDTFKDIFKESKLIKESEKAKELTQEPAPAPTIIIEQIKKELDPYNIPDFTSPDLSNLKNKLFADAEAIAKLGQSPEYQAMYKQLLCKAYILDALQADFKAYNDNNSYNSPYTFDARPLTFSIVSGKKMLGEESAKDFMEEIHKMIGSIPDYLNSANFPSTGSQKIMRPLPMNDFGIMVNDYFKHLAVYLMIKSPYFYSKNNKKEEYAKLDTIKYLSNKTKDRYLQSVFDESKLMTEIKSHIAGTPAPTPKEPEKKDDSPAKPLPLNPRQQALKFFNVEIVNDIETLKKLAAVKKHTDYKIFNESYQKLYDKIYDFPNMDETTKKPYIQIITELKKKLLTKMIKILKIHVSLEIQDLQEKSASQDIKSAVESLINDIKTKMGEYGTNSDQLITEVKLAFPKIYPPFTTPPTAPFESALLSELNNDLIILAQILM